MCWVIFLKVDQGTQSKHYKAAMPVMAYDDNADLGKEIFWETSTHKKFYALKLVGISKSVVEPYLLPEVEDSAIMLDKDGQPYQVMKRKRRYTFDYSLLPQAKRDTLQATGRAQVNNLTKAQARSFLIDLAGT